MKYVLFFSLLILYTTVNCDRSTPESKPSSIQRIKKNILLAKGVKLLDYFNSDSIIFYQISDFFIDPVRDQIIVLDKGIFQIQIFDTFGSLIKSIGKKGVGPGEFTNPNCIGVTNKYIYASELQRPILHQFDHNLNFIKDIDIKDFILSHIALYQKEDLLLTGMTMKKKEFEARIFKTKNMELKKLQLTIPVDYSFIKQKSSPFINLWNAFYLEANKNIFFYMFLYRNIILAVSNNHKIEWQKNIEGLPLYSKPKGKNMLVRPGNKIYRDVTIDKYGNYYLLVGNVGEYYGNEIIVLNETGNRIETLSLPYKAISIKWAKNNILYALQLNRIRINCYQIISNNIKINQ